MKILTIALQDGRGEAAKNAHRAAEKGTDSILAEASQRIETKSRKINAIRADKPKSRIEKTRDLKSENHRGRQEIMIIVGVGAGPQRCSPCRRRQPVAQCPAHLRIEREP